LTNFGVLQNMTSNVVTTVDASLMPFYSIVRMTAIHVLMLYL